MANERVSYSGSCHCGAIEFAFDAAPIIEGLRCDCSICRRKGAVLSNFVLQPDQLKLSVRDDADTCYQFGIRIAKHHFCRVCGIFTYVETRLNPGAIRVNLGCLDDLDVFSLPITVFDGKSL